MSERAARRARKAFRERYDAAATIHWTKDMEREINRIHRWRKIWRAAAAVQFAAIVTGVIWYVR